MILGLSFSQWARLSKWSRSIGYWPRYVTIFETLALIKLRWEREGQPALPEVENTDPIDRSWSFNSVSYITGMIGVSNK